MSPCDGKIKIKWIVAKLGEVEAWGTRVDQIGWVTKQIRIPLGVTKKRIFFGEGSKESLVSLSLGGVGVGRW